MSAPPREAPDEPEIAAAKPVPMGFGRALRLTSLSSLATIAFGVVSNKIVAVVTGTEGIALLGLYRTATAFLVGAVLLGLPDVMVRALAAAKAPQEQRSMLRAIVWIVVVQMLVVIAIGILFAGPAARALFGASSAEHVGELRIVLVLAAGTLALQVSSALLSGLLLVRENSKITLLTSALTVATTYPFLLLGRIGLAGVIGATCFVGAALGVQRVLVHLGVRLRDVAPTAIAPPPLQGLRPSLFLALQPYVVTLGTLGVLTVFSRQYDLAALGSFNAASTLESTGIMVVMGSMRSYVLPTLSKLETLEAKAEFTGRVLRAVLGIVCIGAVAMATLGPVLIRVLYTSSFDGADEMVAVLGISMVGQVFVWCGAMRLIHDGAFRTFFLLDLVWAIVRLAASWFAARMGAPPVAVAWAHAGAYTLSGLLYTTVLAARGAGTRRTLGDLGLGVVAIAILCAISHLLVSGHDEVAWALAVVLIAAAGIVAINSLREIRR